ncbi:MAG: hypothetical protein ABMB14_36185, partial [Myxococcota bacterium]
SPSDRLREGAAQDGPVDTPTADHRHARIVAAAVAAREAAPTLAARRDLGDAIVARVRLWRLTPFSSSSSA